MKDINELEAEYASSHAPTPRTRLEEPKLKTPDSGRDPNLMKASMAPSEEKEVRDLREEVEYTWRFKYEQPETGKVWTAIFKNRVLNLDERLQAAALESQLNGGVAYMSVEPIMGTLAKAVAHLTFSLKDKQQQSPPGWADNFLRLYTTAPVMALYEEVLGHERIFLGLRPDSEEGEGES